MRIVQVVVNALSTKRYDGETFVLILNNNVSLCFFFLRFSSASLPVSL